MKHPSLPILGGALLIFMLAGCKPADNEPGPGGVTVGEAQALDEAAEMVEAKRLPASESSAEAQASEAQDPSE